MSGVIEAGSYKVFVGDNISFQLENFLHKEYREVKKIIVADANTQKHCVSALTKSVVALGDTSVIIIEPGEQSKSIGTCEKIWSELIQLHTDRRSLLINIGGGVVCDVGGFAASVFMRGIDFINIPTSLLAMVDSSIGGKTGINFSGLKNQVGTFRKPSGVFISPAWLKSLPEREMKSGFAEMIKHTLISSPEKWEQMQLFNSLNEVKWIDVIQESVNLKSKIVNSDFREKNIRKTLNFGHTMGHAIESYSLKHDADPLKHGEAIALGMLGELYLSRVRMNFPSQEFSSVLAFIGKHYDYLNVQFHKDEIVKLMKSDKKNENDQLNFVLLRGIGDPVINQTAPAEMVYEALDFIMNFKRDTTLLA